MMMGMLSLLEVLPALAESVVLRHAFHVATVAKITTGEATRVLIIPINAFEVPM